MRTVDTDGLAYDSGTYNQLLGMSNPDTGNRYTPAEALLQAKIIYSRINGQKIPQWEIDMIRARGPVMDSGHIDSVASQAVEARREAAASEHLISYETAPASVQAATLQTGPVIGTAKDPALFPTAAGGALEGQVIAAPGNAMNQVTLDAYRASGGTTTSTYRDEYTNPLNPGETALEETQRTLISGAQNLFARLAGKESTIPINERIGIDDTVSAAPIAAVAGAPQIIGTPSVGGGLLGGLGFQGVDLTPGFNLGISDGSLVQNIQNTLGNIQDTVTGGATISFMGFETQVPTNLYNQYAGLQLPGMSKTLGEVSDGWGSSIDITPGFNLGISDAINTVTHTIDNLEQTSSTTQKAASLLPLLAVGLLAILLLKKR